MPLGCSHWSLLKVSCEPAVILGIQRGCGSVYREAVFLPSWKDPVNTENSGEAICVPV